jgi:LIVCS family branched-chain amino acid:cation transporter
MGNSSQTSSENKKARTLATGFAMFSMFFGAGNFVFPMALGQYAKDKTFFTALGFLISGIGVPFLGLISIILFNGNYKNFFERIGKIPGFVLITAIMALIGPFGAIPRCIALSYSTTQIFLPDFSLYLFSLIACIVIFSLSIRKNAVTEILGYVLTPFLLITLTILILKGLLTSSPPPNSVDSPFSLFKEGFLTGYQTMDLLGAFFFSSVILNYLDEKEKPEGLKNQKEIILQALIASLIGASLLGIVYIGLNYAAAFHSSNLNGVPQDELPGRLATLILGPYAGVVACGAVSLACLTTAIALAAVFAEFVHVDFSKGYISYSTALILTLLISYFVSTLHFTGIVAFLTPILQVCYPSLILLSILNIAHKLSHFKPVKVPVYTLFIITLFNLSFEFLWE